MLSADRHDTEEVTPVVVVTPETGTSLTSDWWSMWLDELDVRACEYGFEAAAEALTALLVRRLEECLEADHLPCELRVFTQLYLASRQGVLAELLARGHRVNLAS